MKLASLGYPVKITKHDPNAARALAGAIIAARKADGAPQREQLSGRLDRTQIASIATGNRRVFARPSAPAPRHLRVIILLDASASMLSDDLYVKGAQTARDLAEATELLPNVKAEVWSHTTKPHVENESYLKVGMDVVVSKLWASGEPTKRIDRYFNNDFESNQDGIAISYVGEKLRSELKTNEQGLIVVISDGQPVYVARHDDTNWKNIFMPKELAQRIANLVRSGMSEQQAEKNIKDGVKSWLNGLYMNDVTLSAKHTAGAVKDLRRKGIGVVSVAIAGALRFEDQITLYGKAHAVPFNPNSRALAKSIAGAIGASMGR